LADDRRMASPLSVPTELRTMTGERRRAPPTDEGWFALHDFRTVDWDAWRDAPERDREAAIGEGRAFLADAVAVEDAADGATAVYTVVGHKADLMLVHLRPTMADVGLLERQFEDTALAAYTEQVDSYVSVTEASGYSEEARGYFEDDEEVREGLARYIETRLYPEIPDAECVCFYPMDKRRDPEYNWYDLPFEERAEQMDAHGEVGREYAGKVTQMITGSIALDDWEWGVTLWGNDPVQFKKLLYEMRFDPSSSKYAEFGPFFVGRRFQPAELGAFLRGEPVGEGADEQEGAGGPPDHVDAGDDGGGGPPDHVDTSGGGDDGDIRGELADMDIYAGQPHGEDVYALVLYSEADTEELFEETRGLRANFDHYDTHVKTAVYAPDGGEGENAVVSIWETQSAADTAAGFLSELPGVVRRAGESEEGWGTMGMFYQVKDDHREDFADKFEEVGGLLAEMDGHEATRLLANHEDETDMFIDSRWDSKDDAMGFFRSDEFGDTVEWGRDVLADRPRHVFLA
jgi:chlorite dismutase/heme-degrading monooxygenase HmoA